MIIKPNKEPLYKHPIFNKESQIYRDEEQWKEIKNEPDFQKLIDDCHQAHLLFVRVHEKYVKLYDMAIQYYKDIIKEYALLNPNYQIPKKIMKSDSLVDLAKEINDNITPLYTSKNDNPEEKRLFFVSIHSYYGCSKNWEKNFDKFEQLYKIYRKHILSNIEKNSIFVFSKKITAPGVLVIPKIEKYNKKMEDIYINHSFEDLFTELQNQRENILDFLKKERQDKLYLSEKDVDKIIEEIGPEEWWDIDNI